MVAIQVLAKRLTDAASPHAKFIGGGTVNFIVDDAPKIAVDEKERQFFGTINTPALDLDDEVVLPSGMDGSYFPAKVRTVYLNHDYANPIGHCRHMVGSAAIIRTLTRIAPTQLGLDALTLIQEGVINGLSVGFVRTDAGPLTPEEQRQHPGAKSIVRKWRCIEYSVTAMPCNPAATIDTKSIDRKMIAVERLLSEHRLTRVGAKAAGFDIGPKVSRAYPLRVVLLDDSDVL